ncbi:hypothetical protein GCM10012279_29560 [Micromonospora yangpuensis]|nr:hypothetical protein GCM10012279_29560 [Micromonospora yangpuensis]
MRIAERSSKALVVGLADRAAGHRCPRWALADPARGSVARCRPAPGLAMVDSDGGQGSQVAWRRSLNERFIWSAPMAYAALSPDIGKTGNRRR